MSHARAYLKETARIAGLIDVDKIEAMVEELVALRVRQGKLFVIGLGGSAANASHAVNDFRRLCGIRACCPTDNAAELTAGANDEGWHNAFLSAFTFRSIYDAVMVLSVGGGTSKVSRPLVTILKRCRKWKIPVLGIVGRDGGLTAKHAKVCVVVPTVEPSRVTPHTEAFQSVILHCLVSHPDLQRSPCKW